jgi:hypothetical protein
MKRAWPVWAKILTGFFAAAMYAMPQAYTVSAKPGVVNYIEGNVSLNGKPVSSESLKTAFLNPNDTLSTDAGKAEVLLAPGIFLRLGDHSTVRMISPSLTDTQIELKAGQAMIEADNIIKDSRLTVLNGTASVLIDRNGLYKLTAGDSPSVAVLDGKANVFRGEQKTEIGKGREISLSDTSKAKKFDAKKQDDLYAWSNVRAAYNAASSYQAARDVNASGYGGVWGGYGYSGFSNPGWMWNSGFNTWSWLPGDGAFYSPFGFGFYGPGVVGYAPVIYAPVYGGGGYWNGRNRGTNTAAAPPKNAAVPVNPTRPPAVGAAATSPAANMAARNQAIRSFNSNGGFRTASGASIPAGRAAVGVAPAGARGGGGMAAPGGGRPAGGFGGGAPAGAPRGGGAPARSAGPSPH